MSKNQKQAQNYKGKNKPPQKKPFNMKKIIIYLIALVFLIIVYIIIGNIGRRSTAADSTLIERTLEFRKDGELDFIDENDQLIVTIEIEIAADDGSRMQGLMSRESMEERQGMLFKYYPFRAPTPITMWMKNTIIPLDMIFVRQDKIISEIVKNTVPFDESHIISKEPVAYVIEVNAGFTDRYGVKAGQIVDWR